MELDTDFNATSSVTSHQSAINTDTNKILLEADEFIAKYDLNESRNEIRKAVLLFHLPDDYERIQEEMIFLEDGSDRHTEEIPTMWIGLCLSAGFLSLLVSFPSPEWDWLWKSPRPAGIWRLLYSITSIMCLLLGLHLSITFNRYWGTRQALRLGAVLALGASFGEFLSHGDHCYYLLRGFSAAAALVLTSTSLLYITETSEPKNRGQCIAIWFIIIILFSDMIQLACTYVWGISVKLISAGLAAAVILWLSGSMPESPYRLALKGRIPEAYHSLRKFRPTELLAAYDIYQIHDVISNRQHGTQCDFTGISTYPILGKYTSSRRLRALLLTCTVLMITRAVSSVFITALCQSADFKPFQGIENMTWLLTFVVYAAGSTFRCVVFTFMALILDRLSRRRTLMALLCGMFICITIGFAISMRTEAQENTAGILYVAFIALHFIAEAPIVLYISEVFPLGFRDSGTPLILSVYTGCTLVLNMVVPNDLKIGFSLLHGTLLILFPISILVTYFFMKETKGLPLEHNSLGI